MSLEIRHRNERGQANLGWLNSYQEGDGVAISQEALLELNGNGETLVFDLS